MRIMLAVAVAALAAVPAHAEQWYLLDLNDSTIDYGDAESVTDYSGYWNVEVFRGYSPESGRSQRFARFSVEINCGLKQYRIPRTTTYDQTDREVSTDETTGEWQSFSRRGLSDKVRRFACNAETFPIYVPDPFTDAEANWRVIDH